MKIQIFDCKVCPNQRDQINLNESRNYPERPIITAEYRRIENRHDRSKYSTRDDRKFVKKTLAEHRISSCLYNFVQSYNFRTTYLWDIPEGQIISRGPNCHSPDSSSSHVHNVRCSSLLHYCMWVSKTLALRATPVLHSTLHCLCFGTEKGHEDAVQNSVSICMHKFPFLLLLFILTKSWKLLASKFTTFFTFFSIF